jgi:hypothetical protein
MYQTAQEREHPHRIPSPATLFFFFVLFFFFRACVFLSRPPKRLVRAR